MLIEAPTSILALNRAVQAFASEGEIDLYTAELEGIAFQKKRDWLARQSIVPLEVLKAAGILDQEEIDFFLGRTNNNPNPLRAIRFSELVLGSETISEEELNVIQPPLPSHRSIPREKRPIKQEIIDGLLFRPLPSQTPEQAQRIDQFSRFYTMVEEAVATTSLDLCTMERRAIEGKLDDGFPAIDPHPDRLPTYRRLVPRPKTVQQETTVFEAVV